MRWTPTLTFKIASEEWEFEQIHRLNHATFVQEIPQHEPSPNEKLVDKFHGENTYIICLHDHQVIGMVAVRGKRPFSLDEKLENLDTYLPRGRSVCELRLLSVEKNHRHGVVLRGLLEHMYQHCRGLGYDLAVISGTVRQQRLYRRLGFVPFGPLVGTPEASYQPMYLTLETFVGKASSLFRRSSRSTTAQSSVILLPGPVSVRPDVRRALSDHPVSHRSVSFAEDFKQTKRALCALVGSRNVEIFMGSGTLANDVIAAQLSLDPKPGLILSNGEFGERLIDHASRFGLFFQALRNDWGRPFDPDDIKRCLDRTPSIEWLWAVHCESSTGLLNNPSLLKGLCAKKGIQLCLDCISSVGTVPLDLTDVYLASGVSGKGLAAFSGLSMVFYNHTVRPAAERLPRYLDLGLYASNDGIPFTVSSNLVHALQKSLTDFQPETHFENLQDLSRWLRSTLHSMGFRLVTRDEHASPAIITIALPEGIQSKNLGSQLEEAGYFLSYKSQYLLNRNWIQICLMGECSQEKLAPLLDLLWQLYPLAP